MSRALIICSEMALPEPWSKDLIIPPRAAQLEPQLLPAVEPPPVADPPKAPPAPPDRETTVPKTDPDPGTQPSKIPPDSTCPMPGCPNHNDE